MANRSNRPDGVLEIMRALRRLFIEHLADQQPLTADLTSGSTVVSILNSSRLRPGDEIFIKSDITGLAEAAVVDEVLPWDPVEGSRIVLEAPIVDSWLTSNASSTLKAINHKPIKRVYLGSLNIIPDFPSISISLPEESNDWWTLRSTEHEYTFKIRVYNLASGNEDATVEIAKFAEHVREILIDHIHPYVDDPPIIRPITSDVSAGDTVVTIDDTSNLVEGGRIYLRDSEIRPAGSQEAVVRAILSPTEFQVGTGIEWDFLVARQAEVLVAQRYLFDTRPSSISYGYTPGQSGTFLAVAEISYFAKEIILRSGNNIS